MSQGTDLSRRNALGIAGVAAATAYASPRAVLAGRMTARQAALTLQVARTGAVFPIEFPSFGESGPAWTRATARRLHHAARRLTRQRLALARAGADQLIADGLLDQPRDRLLAGIGSRACAATGSRDLTSVVALAIATVSAHFDPNADDAALVWIDGLRWLHRRGELPSRGAR